MEVIEDTKLKNYKDHISRLENNISIVEGCANGSLEITVGKDSFKVNVILEDKIKDLLIEDMKFEIWGWKNLIKNYTGEE